ncbi:MAG: biotin-independent malonate decarboxylase subunit beta [Proteobacteria bacterium]|nr:biotin-independent malonate decarboxylase subunit beta [Pseudomonadota bacterium]
MMDLPATILAGSYLESSARERVAGLLDAGSFDELLPPTERRRSPYLLPFGIAAAFDDGIVIGSGRLGGRPVLVAAQEGAFLGGTFGEVHGAKLVGLLRGACASTGADQPQAVLLLLDTGGVRLQEANAGEIAVGDVMVAVLEARAAGIPVVALLGGRSGCFGGGSLVAACCSGRAISEPGRLGVSGPEVIETAMGVEEFDARDRPLVWRVTGGRTRHLLGIAEYYVADTIPAFRAAALSLLDTPPAFDARQLGTAQAALAARALRFPGVRDATEVWARLGLPPTIQEVTDEEYLDLLAAPRPARTERDAESPSPAPFDLSSLAAGALDWVGDAWITPEGVIGGTARTAGGEAIALIGLVHGAPLGLTACVTLSRAVGSIMAETPRRPILILVDTLGQKMSRSDELLGLSQAIGQVAQSIVLARQQGHRVVTLLMGKAAAAAFIALVLMAERVVALPEAEPAVLSLAAVARVTKMPVEELERLSQTTPVLAPGLDPMRQLGVIHAVVSAGPALKQRLESLLLSVQPDDLPEAEAAAGYRHLIAHVQALVAGS